MGKRLRARLTTHELSMRFVLWAEQLRTPPRWEDVVQRFDVCRATAFRLIGFYADAKGMPMLRERSTVTSERIAASLRRFHAQRRRTA